MQCSKTLSVISSTDWERTIRVMKLHQYFEFGPASQDSFSFCQIQLDLNTVYDAPFQSAGVAGSTIMYSSTANILKALVWKMRKNYTY
jgi:hypothetical protein